MSESKHVYVFMGVSGSGKSAVAEAVAKQLNAAFLDGDFLHTRHDILKMASGQALNDEDRATWLERINDAVFAMQRTHPVSFIICSALKKAYRDRVRKDNENVSFIHMQGDFAVIEERLKARKGHFFKPHMLVSQFETLEVPTAAEPDVYPINVNQPLDKVIADVVALIKSQRGLNPQ